MREMRAEAGLDSGNKRVRLRWLSKKTQKLRLWANRQGIGIRKMLRTRRRGPHRKSFLTTLAHKKFAKLAVFEADYIGILSREWYHDIDGIEAINREDPPAAGVLMRLEDLFDKPRNRKERAGPPLQGSGLQRDGSET